MHLTWALFTEQAATKEPREGQGAGASAGCTTWTTGRGRLGVLDLKGPETSLSSLQQVSKGLWTGCRGHPDCENCREAGCPYYCLRKVYKQVPTT